MYPRRLILTVLSCGMLPCLALAQALDASSYALTSAAAEQFVRATQQMVASGASGPSMQGGNGTMDLAGMKAQLDGNPAAQQALRAAGMTSTDYVLFLGAAMQGAMVGQMEQAGLRGMLPPGITQRPPQGNIDFMKDNMEIFTRAMTPGATSAAPPRGAQRDEPDLPVPGEALAVLASDLIDRIPAIDAIARGTMCELPEVTATIERERVKITELYNARYGNPGNSGLERTPAEGAILERAGDSALEACGNVMTIMATPEAFVAADEERRAAQSAASVEEQDAWNACPGIPGGKEPECERRVAREAAAKADAAERRYLAAIADAYGDLIADFRSCAVSREQLVRDARDANVIGANVKLVLRPLTLTWDAMPFVAARWTSICESSAPRLSAR